MTDTRNMALHDDSPEMGDIKNEELSMQLALQWDQGWETNTGPVVEGLAVVAVQLAVMNTNLRRIAEALERQP
jgi:hypothetical protein